jgi:hypothetical protein
VKNTEKKKGEATALQQLSKKLGRNTLVAETLTRLHDKGIKASASLVYKVVAGDMHREDVAEAFLAVAEEKIARRRQLEERARQLAAQA